MLACCIGLGAAAQSDSTGSLYLDIDAVAFFRDAEYFLPYTKGYTASAFRLSPTLRYQIDAKASIEGGVRMTALAGTDGSIKAYPILSIKYKAANWLRFTIGTIEGSLSHQLDEPMYDYERWVYDFQEDGLQILTNTRHWSSDTWVNWEHFLYPWTADQERFTLGSRHTFELVSSHSDGHLLLDASFMGSHRGGQFSDLDTCIETLFNENAGLRWEQRCLNGDYFRIKLPFYFFQNNSPKAERYTPFENGWGVWPSVEMRATWGKTAWQWAAGYYYGYQYLSPRGSYLFQSVSWYDPLFVQRNRHLVTATIGFDHRYKELDLSALAQFYYDPDHKKLDLAIGITLAFKRSFRLLANL